MPVGALSASISSNVGISDSPPAASVQLERTGEEPLGPAQVGVEQSTAELAETAQLINQVFSQLLVEARANNAEAGFVARLKTRRDRAQALQQTLQKIESGEDKSEQVLSEVQAELSKLTEEQYAEIR